MRKLVKKLALVLALVMAIGCIAPASAQAAQVAEKWTWNFDEAGLVKPTKNMLVGETYKFEVLRYGEKLDAEEYSVKYYAKVEGKDGKDVDCDAVIMNTKTGLLYAAEAAKDIKIAAVVKNSEGGTAKVWAWLDVYAASELEVVASPSISLDEALEIGATFTVDSYVALADGDAYDLDVTATIADEKVLTSEDGINFTVVGAGETEIVFTAEGIAPTTLNVVVAAPVVVTPEATPSPTPTVEAALAAVSVAQPAFDTFVVTFNKDLGKIADAKALVSAKIAQKNSTIKYTTLIKSASVNGKELTVVLYNAPANEQSLYFTFNGVEAPAYKVAVGNPATIVVNTPVVVDNKWQDVSITVKDANGTLLYNGSVAKAGACYKIEKVDILNADAFLNSDANQVWYLAQGKTVEFIVKYTSTDEKVKVSSDKVAITSAKSMEETTPYMQFAAGAPGLNTEDTIKKLTFADGISIRLGAPQAIYAKRVKTVSDGIAAAKEVAEYSVLVDAADDSIVYTYEIIDSAIALVMANGTIIPVKEGSTEILIKSTNLKGEVTVVACCPVTVTKATAAQSASFTLSKTTVSNAAGANDNIVVTIEVINNYGEKMPVTSASVELKNGNTKYPFTSTNNKVTIVGADCTTKNTYTVTVKANGVTATQTGVVTVVQPDPKATKTFTLTANPASLAVNPEDITSTVKITANRYYGGIIDGVEAIAGKSSEANEVGKVYYKLSGKNSDKLVVTENVDGTLSISPFTSGNTFVTGTFTVELLEKKVYGTGENVFSQIVTVAAATFEVKDGKAAFSVVTDSTRINSDKEFATVVSGATIDANTGAFVADTDDFAKEILSNMKLYIGKVDKKNLVDISKLSSYKVTGYSDNASTVVVTKVEVTRNNVKYSYDLVGDKMVIITYE